MQTHNRKLYRYISSAQIMIISQSHDRMFVFVVYFHVINFLFCQPLLLLMIWIIPNLKIGVRVEHIDRAANNKHCSADQKCGLPLLNGLLQMGRKKRL